MTFLRSFAVVLVVCLSFACKSRDEPPAPVPAERIDEPPAPKQEPASSHTRTKPPEKPEPPEGMVHVPGGTVDMAVAEELRGGGGPKPTKVDPFFIDRTEVTVAAYLACVESGKCARPTKASECNATARKPRLDHPMNCATKPQADAFCAAQGKRLPTQPEWTFAARGAEGRFYPWGNELSVDQLCWQGRKGAEDATTCPVGSFPQSASPFGALDMAGNVAEWTATPETERNLPGIFYTRGGGYKLGESDLVEPWGTNIRSDNYEVSSESEGRPDLGFRCARGI